MRGGDRHKPSRSRTKKLSPAHQQNLITEESVSCFERGFDMAGGATRRPPRPQKGEEIPPAPLSPVGRLPFSHINQPVLILRRVHDPPGELPFTLDRITHHTPR